MDQRGMTNSEPINRRGFTLIEILLVIVLLGIMSAFALPRFADAVRKQNIRSARVALVGLCAQARATAIQRGSKTKFVLLNSVISIQSSNPVTNASQTVGNPVDLYGRYGVTVLPSSFSLEYDPRGIGTAPQTSLQIAKGSDTTTVVISAAGRVIQ